MLNVETESSVQGVGAYSVVRGLLASRLLKAYLTPVVACNTYGQAYVQIEALCDG